MVLFTVCYMVATGVQTWRLRTIYTKVANIIESQNSVVFLKNSDESNDGLTAALATSELCVNSGEASVGDCFWSNDTSQGISVAPKQLIYLSPFVTFPQAPGLIPFVFKNTDLTGLKPEDKIFTLIETDLLPAKQHQQAAALEIESFGKLIAWKVDTRLAIVLETDARKFSRLILSSFLQNHYLLNDQLPLVRIQTVNVDGTPQNFDEIIKHSRKDIKKRDSEKMSTEDWSRHVEGIQNLGVLANKASEFEFKRNLTEGKTGIVQPDLISSKNIEESLLHTVASPDTPKKKMLTLEKTDEKIMELKVEYERQELLKSPMAPTASFFGEVLIKEKVITPESPKFPTASPSKSPSPSVKSKISSKPQSPKFPTGSPAKKKVFATNDKPSTADMEPKITNQPPTEIDGKKFTQNIQQTNINFIASEKKTPIQIEVKIPEAFVEVKNKIAPTKPKPLNLKSFKPQEPIKLSQEPKLPSLKSSNSIRRQKQTLMSAKPPNILVYSDSITTRDNVIKTLGTILQKNSYTVYALSAQQVCSRVWVENTSLLIVCGSVNGSEVGTIFMDYFFKGGKVLCLCSDLLRHVLPTYHTAEVREHELVQFSYGKWKNIKMMHHIFCYQPSPVRKHFSQESDEPPKERPSSAENPSVELKDQYGVSYNIRVQTLGTEDTWKTPSLLMVYTDNGGKIVFSQIHLEVDPSIYEGDDQKYPILMKNENLRHEIFSDVLGSHLGLNVNLTKAELEPSFTKGYFLGRHELKFEVLELLKSKMEMTDTMKLDGLTVKFCGKNVDAPVPAANLLPIMIHTCPDDFSTLDYFDSLKSEHVGRLLMYSKVLVSSTILLNNIKYSHGFAVVPRELISAKGRGNNKWLSPAGCLMFSLQLHIPLSSPIGQRVSLIQILIATAVVETIQKLPGYEMIDIGLKWPNDIYANSNVKIGGVIVNSLIEGELAICNIGLGVNLSNSLPTTCINDLILAYNKKSSKNLPVLTFEKALAIIFNEIEDILNRVQSGDLEYLYELYYKCWLHSGSMVNVSSIKGQEKRAKILGIDEYGFLKIQIEGTNQIESVQPDGNSFDMLRGLIVPKSP